MLCLFVSLTVLTDCRSLSAIQMDRSISEFITFVSECLQVRRDMPNWYCAAQMFTKVSRPEQVNVWIGRQFSDKQDLVGEYKMKIAGPHC